MGFFLVSMDDHIIVPNLSAGPISNLVVICKSSLIPAKNSQRISSQFHVSVLDKYSQPPTNLAKEIRSIDLLEKHLLDLERERTPAALQAKVEKKNRENEMWTIRMTKHTMKISQCLQSSYLDFLHDRLLQPLDSRLKVKKYKMIEDEDLPLK